MQQTQGRPDFWGGGARSSGVPVACAIACSGAARSVYEDGGEEAAAPSCELVTTTWLPEGLNVTLSGRQ
jgi:hypothetical protein